ncbi:MAG TPA: DUF692 domain-containing protein [Burkholderiaceae bacterium]|nr:DUF692 domain-containing protein [Burkholderiaceae bacterium]
MEDVLRHAGIGLRSPHYAEFLHRRPGVPLVEVHSENCFGGGRHLDVVLQARRDCEVSLHGVGLSLGSADPLSERHLRELKALVDRVQPMLVSDHVCWSSIGGVYANDLLPMPQTREALAHMARRVDQAQQTLRRRMLVENVSSYLQWQGAEMSEWEFMVELSRASGCGILLDVNNVYVSAVNHGFDAIAYLDAMPADLVGEIHLAGHTANPVTLEDGTASQLLIDTHSRPVCEEVWALYEHALSRLGPKPTIIEWDADIPPMQTLLDEAAAAGRRMQATSQRAQHAGAA